MKTPNDPNFDGWVYKTTQAQRAASRTTRMRRLAENPNYRANQAAEERHRLLAIYGAFCDFCGETDESVLEFDHVFPKLTTHQLSGYTRTEIREDPFLVHVLCANCHKRKSNVENTSRRKRP
jgi:5-methylcytosine-specific restriction endonuclease McrA